MFWIIIITLLFPLAEPVFAEHHITVDKNQHLVKNGKTGRELWTNFETGANIKALAFEGNMLWLGMPNGIIKYDTQSLNKHTIYTSKSTNGGLLSNGIFAIKIDKNNTKWFGTYGGGVTSFDGKKWTTYNPYGYGDARTYGKNWTFYKKGDGLGDLWVYDFLLEEDSKMLVATWKGVSFFDGEKFKTYTTKDGLIDKWVYSLAKDRKGRYWFGTEGGITMLSGDKWESYTHEDGLGAEIQEKQSKTGAVPKHHSDPTKTIVNSNPNYVLSIAIDKDDNKWFGTWGAGLSMFDGKTWTTYTDKNGLGGNFIHTLAIDNDGILWAGTDGGASFFVNGKWYNYTKEHGLQDKNVFSIAFDKKGNRWFGTWTGLSKLEIIYH